MELCLSFNFVIYWYSSPYTRLCLPRIHQLLKLQMVIDLCYCSLFDFSMIICIVIISFFVETLFIWCFVSYTWNFCWGLHISFWIRSNHSSVLTALGIKFLHEGFLPFFLLVILCVIDAWFKTQSALLLSWLKTSKLQMIALIERRKIWFWHLLEVGNHRF